MGRSFPVALLGLALGLPALAPARTVNDCRIGNGAVCAGARLAGADLRGAPLEHVNFLRGANLEAADLTGADLTGARTDASTVFVDATLAGRKGCPG